MDAELTYQGDDALVHVVIQNDIFGRNTTSLYIRLCYDDLTWGDGRDEGEYSVFESMEIVEQTSFAPPTCLECILLLHGIGLAR